MGSVHADGQVFGDGQDHLRLMCVCLCFFGGVYGLIYGQFMVHMVNSCLCGFHSHGGTPKWLDGLC